MTPQKSYPESQMLSWNGVLHLLRNKQELPHYQYLFGFQFDLCNRHKKKRHQK
ncbi:hypothetical protein Hanom_Chr09g00868711 [Helianthus anomalus]